MGRPCEFIKGNGQQCRAFAMWGSEPPRCVFHRQDGGPRPYQFEKGNQYSRLKATHGFYRRAFSANQSMAEEAGQYLLTHEQLSALIAVQPADARLVRLYRLFAWNLDHLVKLLERYHEETGGDPDRLLEVANGRPKVMIVIRLERLRAELEAEQTLTYETTSGRAGRYWLVYEFIVDYIRRYSVGPTHREIKAGCCRDGLFNFRYWLDRLEEDGLIRRYPGRRRGIELAEELPLALRLFGN